MEPSTASMSASNGVAPQAKRNRVQLSCTPCRLAKLKCDRVSPCTQCQKKDRAASCVYPKPLPKKKAAISMQKRLKQLESLVKDVMHAQAPGPQTPPRDEDSVNEFSNSSTAPSSRMDNSPPESNLDKITSSPQSTIASGQVHTGGEQKSSTYVGATHWAAILDNIEEVKDYFDEADQDEVEDEAPPRTDLLFNIGTMTTKSELIANLPPRGTCDTLISRYFNAGNAALQILHRPLFQREYVNFWANPQGCLPTWLGLIYGIMCLSLFSSYAGGESNPDPRGGALEMARKYREACIQCLRLSDYTRPGQYTIECLLVHLEGEFVLADNDQVGSYLLLGVAVRLALRMGFHRDPDKVCAHMSPFDKEMRRRLWHLLIQIDMLASFHIGLPSMGESIDSDTLLPRNLHDSDFDENSTELPPSRPETEITSTSYLRSKSRICIVFGKIATHANSLSVPSYDEILRLDKALLEAYEQIPSCFMMQPLEFSITEEPKIILFRFNIGHLFQKSRCVLHRQFLFGIQDRPAYEYSIKTGLEAAMELLYFQTQIYEATRPGAPLCRDRCFPSSLLMHDYLLASMIVYMRTMQIIESEAKGQRIAPEIQKQKSDILAALTRSAEIWQEAKVKFVDGKKASDVLNMMLNKIHAASASLTETITPASLGMQNMASGSIAGLSLEDGFAMDFPINNVQDLSIDYMTDPFASTAANFDFNPILTGNANQVAPFESMMDLQSEFDWSLFDNHVRPQQNYSEIPVDSLIAQENFEKYGV